MSAFEFDVFLSHSSRDKHVVRKLANRLKEDGLRVWFDEWTVRPGDVIPLAIEQGLRTSRTLILIMSKQSLEASDWVTLERNVVLFRDPTNRERRFIPVRIDGTPVSGILNIYNYVDLSSEDEDQYRRLLEACRPTPKLLSKTQHDALLAAGQHCMYCGRPLQLQQLVSFSEVVDASSPGSTLVLCTSCGRESQYFDTATKQSLVANPWINTVSDAGATDGQCFELCRIEITADRDLSNFDSKEQKRLQHVIAAFLGISALDIRVVSARKGSVILKVELPRFAAMRLIQETAQPSAEFSGILDYFDIVSIREVDEPTGPRMVTQEFANISTRVLVQHFWILANRLADGTASRSDRAVFDGVVRELGSRHIRPHGGDEFLDRRSDAVD